MCNKKLWITTFTLAVALGLGIALVLPEQATAIYCPYSLPGMNNTGVTCECGGEYGTWIEYWQGRNLDWTYCGYVKFCSTCPPHGIKGPFPYNPPGEGGGDL